MKQIILVLLFVSSVIATHVYGQDNQPMIGEQASDFTLEDLAGNMIVLSELRDNFVVIHFAASW